MPSQKSRPKPVVPGAVEDADAVVSALLTASRLLVAVSARSLATVEESLTLPQFRALVILDAEGRLNVSRLAERLDVNPSTAKRMAERLVQAGVVAREVNAGNRREVLLRPTAAGRAVVREVTERRRREISRIVAAMPTDRRADMVAALEAFSAAGGEPPADRSVALLPGWR